jgi:hypothetical protein
MIKPPGKVYIGEWSQGRPHGQMTIRISGESEFTGTVVNGSREGYGTEVFEDGTTYKGNYSGN